MTRRVIKRAVMLAAILLLPLLILVAEDTRSLLIEGPQGQTRVIRVQGKNYVELDEVARITGGSLHFERNQIVLTLPGSGRGDTSSQATQSAPIPSEGLSRPFLDAGIETMRQILEWHAALKSAIERGYPLSDVWIEYFRREIQASLMHTEATASTEMDQKAFPLLTNEFNTMNVLTDQYIKITVSRNYLAPNSLNSNPLSQKLLTCSQSLASMASSNQFVDDGSCQ